MFGKPIGMFRGDKDQPFPIIVNACKLHDPVIVVKKFGLKFDGADVDDDKVGISKFKDSG
jgi:hypothetical protein